ncbi:hypothetical protein MJI47_27550, partial [Salmonella enterica subsp. enterica serovar Kentucky]|nr:hypothetical protein [Salmonella enterica subsp. enterica serovar Kentucky]
LIRFLLQFQNVFQRATGRNKTAFMRLPGQLQEPFRVSNHISRGDTVETHAAALRYIDARIDGLLNIFRQTGGETFVIVCSDHGT